MSDLTQKNCVPCEANSGVMPYAKDETEGLLDQVPGWQLDESSDYLQITKQFKFEDFKQAMNFVNQVADLAEQEGHHPNIHIKYSQVWLELYTHAIGGLHENDFIMAAKINKIN